MNSDFFSVYLQVDFVPQLLMCDSFSLNPRNTVVILLKTRSAVYMSQCNWRDSLCR